MKIELKKIKIKDIVEGYENNQEDGVVGYNGKLDIRPKYQREFVYDDNKRNEVIKTIMKDFPLNVMYWVKKDYIDDEYELLDGQQRTVSICEYAKSNFSVNINGEIQVFHSLTEKEKEDFLNYELMIYFCEGNDKEKLDWFKIINIAGEPLTEQELRNAVYTGTWLSDAKRYFSRTGCPAYEIGKKYINGSTIRQDYLERILKWITNNEKFGIEEYMSKHQQDKDAIELWDYFQDVINWIQKIFPDYKKEMKGLEWGLMYNKYSKNIYNSNELKEKIQILMEDEEVTSKKGIYEYLLSGKEKFLSLRAFSDKIKREQYEEQEGICAICKKYFDIKDMEADHIIPWSQGGKTDKLNCQMLCRNCNREKSDK